MPIQETKAVLSEDGKTYSYRSKNVDINAGFCSVFIVFARIGDDKKHHRFVVEMMKKRNFNGKKNTN
jgi:hypothetical protein